MEHLTRNVLGAVGCNIVLDVLAQATTIQSEIATETGEGRGSLLALWI